MAKLSVPQAAERLGVSPARVRQRIEDGSLAAEKIGGRWIVDLGVSQPAPPPRGRPVAPASVWWSLLAADVAKLAISAGIVKAGSGVNQPAISPSILKKISVASDPVISPRLAKQISAINQPLIDPKILALSAASAPSKPVVSPKLLQQISAINKSAANAKMPGLAGLSKPALNIELFKLAAAVRPAIAGAWSSALLPRMRLAEAQLADISDAAYPAQVADLLVGEAVVEASRLSASSRRRAVARMASAIEDRNYDALLAWLRNRASRHLYVAADQDLAALRSDERIVLSGLSHPGSGMEDPRIVEGYVNADDLQAVAKEYWLDPPSLGERVNVALHAAPIRPASIDRMLLAADLAEHGGPRELGRARELLEEAIAGLLDNEIHT